MFARAILDIILVEGPYIALQSAIRAVLSLLVHDLLVKFVNLKFLDLLLEKINLLFKSLFFSGFS